MTDRIKSVRKKLNLTQTEFGKKIGLSRDNVANIEGNRIEIKDITIKSICREFDVNEDWLRTGQGEMFVQKSKAEEISELLGDIQRADEDGFKSKLVSALAQLDENGWDVLEKLVDAIANKRK